MFGYTIPQLIFLILLLVLISSFASVAIGYGSVTIGQLYAKHKIAGSILSYIGIYFLSQLLTTGLTFVVGFSNTFTLMINNDPSKIDSLAFYRALYGPMIPLLLITFTIFGVTCYIISGIILKKRINLD